MPVTTTVAVLFTDLVDSTRLSAGLDAEAADGLRKVHFGLLRAALAQGEGREVKNLGDGLMVVAPSPSGGVAIAVAMQRAVEGHNRDATIALGVRIGLAAGEVTAEDDDFFGDPVVEAARLCALAEAGQILTTDTVRVLAGRRTPHRFEIVGERELKGLPDPVGVVEVAWEPLGAPADAGDWAPPPFPLRLGEAGGGLLAFAGRAAEVDVLAQVFKAAAAEARLRVVLVGGEPGIGKTVLVSRAARAATDEGAFVLYGACDESLAAAYHPWVTMLSTLAESLPDDAIGMLSDVHREALGRLIGRRSPRLVAASPDRWADPSLERLLLVEAITALLAVGSKLAPVVAVIDDLQWADAATVALVRHLLAADDALRVLLVGTYRPADIGHSHPLAGLLGDLRREPRGTRLELMGLSSAEVVSVMESAAGQPLGEGGLRLAEALGRETDGNPFFVSELLRHLSETGAVVQDRSGRYALRAALDEIGLPGSIREVVCHRVARLGADVERLFGLAAVAGQGFDVELLAALSGQDPDAVLDALDAGRAAGLVVEHRDTGRWSFSHSLVQHTLYQELGLTRRQRAHQKLGELLEGRRPQSVAELARHWLAATRPADSDKALRYAIAAGDEARDQLSPEDAVAWYERAVELVEGGPEPDGRTRARLLVAIGTEQWRAGDRRHRTSLLDAASLARQLGDAELLAAAALARGVSGSAQAPSDPEFLAVIEAALGALGPGASPTRARLLVELANELDPRDWSRRVSLREEARKMAEGLGDEATLLHVLTGYAFDLAADTTGQLEGLVAVTYDLAERVGDLSARFQAVQSLIVERGRATDIDAVDRLLPQLHAIADASKLAQHRYVADWMSAWREMLAGRLDRAEAYATSGYEAGKKAGDPSALANFAVQLSQIRGQQGRGGEVIEMFRDAVESAPSILVMRTVLVGRSGPGADAVELLDHDTANRFDDYPRDVTWLGTLCQSARAAIHHGHRGAALVLFDLLTPHAGLLALTSSVDYGAVDLTLGRLARSLDRPAEAGQLLSQALRIHVRLKAPYWTAATQIELARHRGGTSEARTLATDALATARAHGYRPLERRAAAILA